MPAPEQLAYPAHGGHQRLFNHRERVFELAVKVHCHLLRPVLLAFEEYAQQPVVPGERIPVGMFPPASGGAVFVVARDFQKPLRSPGVGIENHVLDGAAQAGLDIVVWREHSGVDYPHVKARRARVV